MWGHFVASSPRLPDIPAEGTLRPEAILMHGTDDMSTDDIFEYFVGYSPSFVEWINDSSCELLSCPLLPCGVWPHFGASLPQAMPCGKTPSQPKERCMGRASILQCV